MQNFLLQLLTFRSGDGKEILLKNQYIGDIGDYGKYGLLRFLSSKGLKIGVNWYLTLNDGSNDGKKTAYLDKGDDRLYDPELFDFLRGIAGNPEKTVLMREPNGAGIDCLQESFRPISSQRQLGSRDSQ